MSAEPQRPEAPEDVTAWLAERLDEGTSLGAVDAIADDMPPPVATWYAAYRAWLADREEWAQAQPLDRDPAGWRWRMFGGEWLPGWLTIDAGSWRHDLSGAVRVMVDGGTPEAELRRIAGEIYEWRAMDRAAQERIARMLRRGE